MEAGPREALTPSLMYLFYDVIICECGIGQELLSLRSSLLY